MRSLTPGFALVSQVPQQKVGIRWYILACSVLDPYGLGRFCCTLADTQGICVSCPPSRISVLWVRSSCFLCMVPAPYSWAAQWKSNLSHRCKLHVYFKCSGSHTKKSDFFEPYFNTTLSLTQCTYNVCTSISCRYENLPKLTICISLLYT